MGDVGALAVARVAAQRAVGAAQRPVMDRDQVREAPHPEAAHARVSLVDGVPAEALLDAFDGLEALPRVELQCAVDVDARNLDATHAAVEGGLVEDPAGEPELRVG